MTKSFKENLFIPILCVLIFCIIAFVLGSAVDQNISEKFWNLHELNLSWFEISLCLIGPLVSNLLGVFAGSCLLLTPARENKVATIIYRVIGGVGICLVSYFAYTSGSEFAKIIPGVSEQTTKILKLVVAGIIVVMDGLILLFTLKKTRGLDQDKLIWVSLTSLIIIALVAGSTEIIKYLASRPRPRVVYPELENFRAWYQWKPFYGFSHKECKSFVSGHSANAAYSATLLPLMVSVTKLGEKKNTSLVCTIIGIMFALLVAISRIFALAHFLTDVAGGLILSFVISMLTVLVMDKIRVKVVK